MKQQSETGTPRRTALGRVCIALIAILIVSLVVYFSSRRADQAQSSKAAAKLEDYRMPCTQSELLPLPHLTKAHGWSPDELQRIRQAVTLSAFVLKDSNIPNAAQVAEILKTRTIRYVENLPEGFKDSMGSVDDETGDILITDRDALKGVFILSHVLIHEGIHVLNKDAEALRELREKKAAAPIYYAVRLVAEVRTHTEMKPVQTAMIRSVDKRKHDPGHLLWSIEVKGLDEWNNMTLANYKAELASVLLLRELLKLPPKMRKDAPLETKEAVYQGVVPIVKRMAAAQFLVKGWDTNAVQELRGLLAEISQAQGQMSGVLSKSDAAEYARLLREAEDALTEMLETNQRCRPVVQQLQEVFWSKQ